MMNYKYTEEQRKFLNEIEEFCVLNIPKEIINNLDQFDSRSKSIDLIIPNLSCGSYLVLKPNTFQHVLICVDNLKEESIERMKNKLSTMIYYYDIDDDSSLYNVANEYLKGQFLGMANKVNELIKCGNKVCVCCHAGMSRSITVIILYLMKYHQLSLFDAYKLVLSKRPIAQPNDGFLLMLRDLEKIINKENENCLKN